MVKLFIDPSFFLSDSTSMNSHESEDLPSNGNSVYDDLRREIAIIRSLWHSHIVIFYDDITSKGLLGYVMEYFPRGNLHDYIVMNGPMPEREIKKVLLHVLQALAYLADSYIVHRDIKTANILIANDGSYKICDFGSSVFLDVPFILFYQP